MVEPHTPEAEPPLLMTSEPGSFARMTIEHRKPQIIDDVLRDSDYPPEIRRALRALANELAGGDVQPLSEPALDFDYWQAQWCPYAGLTWLNVPWYFAEAFFYRRLLEAVRYFQPGLWYGQDPFAAQKRRQIEGPGGALQMAAELMLELPADPAVAAQALLYASLWGNRLDLSNRGVLTGAGLEVGHPRDLLIDDSAEVVSFLTAGTRRPRIDFICDNAGPEVTFDLLLADLILERSWAEGVRMHLKPYPFFVSDAMVKDVRELIARLEGEPERLSHATGDRLAGRYKMDRLQLVDHPFWASSYSFAEMPGDLRRELAEADLVILKGDVNYRRLLGDRHWPHTASLAEIAAYFPAPLVALRTLKAEIMVGLSPGRAEALAREDAEWLTSGKRGLIQFVVPAGARAPGQAASAPVV